MKNIIETIQGLILENKLFLKYNSNEFLNYMNNEIDYGWIDKNNKIYKESELDSQSWKDNYVLQIKDRLSKTKIGHCWDFVELERFYFNYYNIPTKTYLICDKELTITHTFLIFNNNYWFESAWYKQQGIHKVKNFSEVQKIFEKYHKIKSYIYNYAEPQYAMNQFEFINYCIK